MRFILLTGLVVLWLCVCANGSVDQSPNPKEAMKLLCELFPNALKSKCQTDQSLVENDRESKAFGDIHVHLHFNINSNNLADSVSQSKLPYCNVCKRLIGLFEKVIKKSLTIEFVQKKFIDLCEIYKSPLKDQCKKFYQGPGLDMIKALLKSEDSEKICKIINLCGTSETLSHEYLESLEHLIHLNDPKENCNICIRFTRWYEETIDTSKTATDIQKPVLEFCHIMNDRIEMACISYFKTAGILIIEAILKKEDPKLICKSMGFCKDSSISAWSSLRPAVSEESPIQEISTGPKEACRYCIMIVKHYEEIINKSVPATSIQNIMFDLCKLYKSPVQDKCIQFYKGPGFEMIKAILKSVKPRKVCQIIRLCHRSDEMEGEFLELFSIIAKKTGGGVGMSKACKMCIRYMQFEENNIDNTKTATEVQKVSMRACDILRAREQRFCKIFYQTIGLELIQGILKKKCPVKLCHIVNYCMDGQTENEQSPVPQIEQDADVGMPSDDPKKTCRICKAIIKRYEQLVNKSLTPEFVQKQFLDLCALFRSPVKENCIKFYKGPGFEIIKAVLKSEDPKKVCQIIKICLKTEGVTRFSELFDFDFLDKDSKRGCQMCMKSVAWYEKEIDSSKTAVEIQKVSIQFCHIFKHHTKNYCIFFYMTIGMEVIEGILKKEDPKKICKLMYYCRQKSIASSEEAGINGNNGNEEICNTIKTILQEIRIPANEVSLNQAFDKACMYLPISREKQCADFVKKYRQEVIRLFMDGVDWEIICTKIKICNDDTEHSIQSSEDGTTFLPATESNLKKASALCSVLVSPLNETCIKIISEKSNDIIENMLKTGNLKGLYEVIEAHYKDKIVNFKKEIYSKEHVENPIECLACKLIMKELAKILSRDASKEKIERALRKVCKVFHGKMRGKCEKFINKFYGRILDLLLKKYGPKEICKKLALCSNVLTEEDIKVINILLHRKESEDEMALFKQEEIKKDYDNPIHCLLCKTIMHELSKLIHNKKSKEEIIRALERVCNMLPFHLKDQCNEFIHKYGSQIVDFIMNNVLAEKICYILHLCSVEDNTSFMVPRTNYL